MYNNNRVLLIMYIKYGECCESRNVSNQCTLVLKMNVVNYVQLQCSNTWLPIVFALMK